MSDPRHPRDFVIEASRDLAAPPEVVWAVVSDAGACGPVGRAAVASLGGDGVLDGILDGYERQVADRLAAAC